MRNFALAFIALGLLVAAPASADFSDGLVGFNGVVTSPLDPILGVVAGDPFLTDVGLDLGPLTPVTDRVVGAVTGTISGVVRALTGAFDVLTFPFSGAVGGPFSPDPAVSIPGLAD
jgi:hypothetical protein